MSKFTRVSKPVSNKFRVVVSEGVLGQQYSALEEKYESIVENKLDSKVKNDDKIRIGHIVGELNALGIQDPQKVLIALMESFKKASGGDQRKTIELLHNGTAELFDMLELGQSEKAKKLIETKLSEPAILPQEGYGISNRLNEDKKPDERDTFRDQDLPPTTPPVQWGQPGLDLSEYEEGADGLIPEPMEEDFEGGTPLPEDRFDDSDYVDDEAPQLKDSRAIQKSDPDQQDDINPQFSASPLLVPPTNTPPGGQKFTQVQPTSPPSQSNDLDDPDFNPFAGLDLDDDDDLNKPTQVIPDDDLDDDLDDPDFNPFAGLDLDDDDDDDDLNQPITPTQSTTPAPTIPAPITPAPTLPPWPLVPPTQPTTPSPINNPSWGELAHKQIGTDHVFKDIGDLARGVRNKFRRVTP